MEENVKFFDGLNKSVIGACLEEDLSCSLLITTPLSAGSGLGSAHIFNTEQLQTLISECRNLIFGTGDLEPPSEDTGGPVSGAIGDLNSVKCSEPTNNNSPRSEVSYEPAMETGQRKANEPKKKHHVKFEGDQMTTVDDQIKPLAACTVAAAVVGAAAEHLSRNRKASSAGVRAANATASVARAVANGDADAATDALNEVVKIVDNLANTSKQKENGFDPAPKSKTCVIL